MFICMVSGVFWTMLSATPAEAATYYVSSAKRNDSRTGLAEREAWQTLGRATAAATAGDTVLVMAGVYRETLCPANSGARGIPLYSRRILAANVKANTEVRKLLAA